MGQKVLTVGLDGIATETRVSDLTDYRTGVTLLGAYDSVNREFQFPQPVAFDPLHNTVAIYHGGRRLNVYEYLIVESSPGSGVYNQLRLTQWAPDSRHRLIADYVAA